MGIDSYVVDWYGFRDLPSTDLAYMNKNFRRMLSIAEKLNFRLAVMYEPKVHYIGWIPHANRTEELRAITSDLRYVLNEFTTRSAYLSVDGVPLIFVWNTIGLTVAEWQSIVDQLESEGYIFALVGDLPDPKYYGPFAGLWGWISYSGIVHYGYEYQPYIWETKINQRLSAAAKDHPDRFFCAGVWPGFNDTGVNGWGEGPRVLDRLNGDFYAQTWRAALESQAQCIMIMTFNDWNEGTIIEPSVEHGYKYAFATISFIEQLKGVDLDETMVQKLTEHYIQTMPK